MASFAAYLVVSDRKKKAKYDYGTGDINSKKSIHVIILIALNNK